MPMSTDRCFGALALELVPSTLADRLALDQESAGALGERIARDLARHAPEAPALDLALVAAHFDPVELLRPRWPVHATLADLAARAPGRADQGRIIAFGSDDGRLPAALAPDGNYVGGPLRLVPFALVGEAATAAAVGMRLEETLLDTGMADPATALLAQDAFGAQVEHARYLTLHDLVAMTAMQYGHAGLDGLWPLIEAALLAPGEEVWLDAPPEPLLRHADGGVRAAGFDIGTWADAGLVPAETGPERFGAAFGHFQRRQRQLLAVLGAHGIGVETVAIAPGEEARGRLVGG
ncbi:hypothetical protein [Coralloluteibacterium stylophorae]|uniref:Uncharacterized protein n=1 Tax=Coralloluteibacterium stylophorae TaxID=1776034 RepID=A0A8J8AX05_9GAMM|nr:hypothetical protein [Coralloluteibacterium stylophorae]MBS7457394.1 hypothetical protein [Coralloluteibacterium stylophorae]